MKYNVWTTNFKNSVYKTSYNTNFVTHCCKTLKLCIQPNSCFISINCFLKTFSFIFGKNIKKWQKFIAFFLNSKFYISIATGKEFKQVLCILFKKKKKKVIHYSLPYIGHVSNVTKKNLRHTCESFCKDIDIKSAYSQFKRSSFISCKDTLL